SRSMRRVALVAGAVLLLASSAPKDGYIVSVGDDNTFNTGTNLNELLAVRKHMTGRYVWVRRDGHEYVIRDETTVRRAEALFASPAALAPEQEALGREESALDREADRLEDAETRTAAEERRLEEIRARKRVVARRERDVDRQEEELERAAER